MGTGRGILERFFGAWSDGKADVLDEVLADDAVVHYGDTPNMGREGLKQLAEAFFEAFPDGEVTLGEIVENGDRVAATWTYTGTHTGTLFGIPPTGKRFRADGMNMERVQDGRIVEHWSVFDQMTAFRQLGLAPES